MKKNTEIYKDCDNMSKTLEHLAYFHLKITKTSERKFLYLQYTNLSSSLLESKGIFHNGTPIHFLCSISLCKA